MPGPRRRRAPSIRPAEQHTEWLGLLSPDGPFLSAEVLVEAFPDGLPAVDTEVRQALRQGWHELDRERTGALVPAWIELVLDRLLGWDEGQRAQPTAEGARVVPEFALFGPGPSGREERLHFHRLPLGTEPARSQGGRPSPVEAAAARCRESGVPLALVTDGQYWALVHALPGKPTSVGVFDADLWGEEPLLLQAFAALLESRRVRLPARDRGGEPTNAAAALFERTFDKQSDLTEDLGHQVLRAVELLVAEIARLDRESSGRFLEHVGEREIYKGALTVLMRLVFLLYAEEQRLLPTDDLYADHYSVSRLHDQLTADRDRLGEEVVDRRAAAWPRLLALFNGIHRGSEHPDLRLPPYGGSLFDPRTYAWLEGFAVADRVVFEILDALVMLKPRTKKGTPTRISYRGLGVEDIGHVYEGLLEFSVRKTQGPYVGLRGKLEPELPLWEVEEAYSEGEEAFLDWLQDETKATRPQLKKMLAAKPGPEERSRLHSAWDSDAELTERTLPFWGLLRTDLRDDPTVFPDRSVVFTQVGERRKTGTHYTPRELAEKVVRHTLEPLVYQPGPADGVPESEWRVKPADELLKLKVVDPAAGSGAFLVAATRYLGERVVEAWQRDGLPEELRQGGGEAGGEPGEGQGKERGEGSAVELEDVRLYAKRRVAASCIYGVDRDDMAVELAKLSMWLETLARDKPFSFLDHALKSGDSLVGLVNEEQVRAFHTDPEEGRAINARLSGDVGEYIGRVLGEVTGLRREIESLPPVNDPEGVRQKEKLNAEADARLTQLRLACDGVVAAALAAERYAELDLEDYEKRLQDAEDKQYNWQDAYNRLLTFLSDEFLELLDEGSYDFYKEEATKSKIRDWLRGDRDQPIKPMHWAIEFPEVMGKGGFDAVVGNPPFSGGQKLTGNIGRDVREYLVVDIAKGKRGSADLCSYFLLRNLDLAPKGRTGIIATNTIAQGDTREVGLDQVVEREGWQVYRAVKSQKWPGSANVHVSLVWAGHSGQRERAVLSDAPVPGITPSLDPQSRVTGNPWRLVANSGKSFQGSNVLGEGFILEPDQAKELIQKNPKNREVIFPYLIGKDLNSRPDCSPSRWVINFGAMSEEEAREYPEPFEIIERDVKSFRMKNNRKVYRDYWWQYGEKRPAMMEAISGLDRVLVIARVSRTGQPVLVDSGMVMSEQVVVFAHKTHSMLANLSSAQHYVWVVAESSSMKVDLRYTPSSCFETFPMPVLTSRISFVGKELDQERREIMLRRQLGLTKLYNLVHDEGNQGDVDIDRLREIHVEIDEAVKEAYGWSDLDLQHGHHETDQGMRWTVSPAARVEILDRLLQLNFDRHAEEERKGIWPPKKKSRKTAKAKEAAMPVMHDGLFPPEGTLF
ncbi:Eco57I restriction-modification methylase domain-containing protein [Nocardiopsis sp. CNT312]|uniref:Eco57I restriction-modification methylase domain-containing protein n=1 Tax=Nocardiopsis sp. CNT312 TaxID=1137268 RepID=UPI00048D3614|nr:DNA methyltransferase [Nocardiopsis sp. CNT312]